MVRSVSAGRTELIKRQESLDRQKLTAIAKQHLACS
jgi:hypothetical protein